ncbi:hypothetical protein KL86DYS2_10960 [uncultured Dysgonomonas sp.]|uniref:Uncharacterized protein n=1 Tax=uncultured Dysgonomonas sp. TaxID=206096 RepID=A0A212J8D0_9BACT|nr:hypothetical protein KL86DYS2_10960 [uncultured Dysgonomonas sp.]
MLPILKFLVEISLEYSFENTMGNTIKRKGSLIPSFFSE